MKKKLVSISLIILTILTSITVYGDGDIEINSDSALLMDYNSGEIIYEKNMDQKVNPASITKVMTLLLTMEALDSNKIKLSDKVNISEYASSMGGTQLYLDVGETQSVESLIKAISIRSANDAAVALGEFIAGSNESFIKMMNNRAQELGMKSTNFTNSTGLPKENHYTTAYDIAIMSKELLKHEDIHDYLSTYMEEIDVGKNKKSTQTMVNTNKLIKSYDGITGIKTGFTNKSKHCISASAKRDELHLIAVVMGAESSEIRFTSAEKLLDYGFSNYESVSIGQKGDTISTIPVEKGNVNSVEIVMEESSYILLPKDDDYNIDKVIDHPKYIKAPTNRNHVVGKLKILVNNKVVDSVNLITKNSVQENKLIDMVNKSVQNFLFNK